MSNFVLASASPRRKELLARYIKDFETLPQDVDERFDPEKDIKSELLRVSGMKAEAAAKIRPDSVVISADTIVVKNNIVLGKPLDDADARRMLTFLRDGLHEVMTGVCVIYPGGGFSFVDVAEVLFHNYDDKLIDWYISTGEPFGKAGAYAIQGLGCVLADSVHGDYNTIVGLPLAELIRNLSSRGLTTGSI